MSEEVQVLWRVPLRIWDLLGEIVGGGLLGFELRSECIAAAEACAAYTDRKFFGPLRRYPWALAVAEDTPGALQELWALREPPEDDTASKIWRLGKAGVDPGPLAAAVRMMRQARFTTLTVEQLHGLTSAVHRFHSAYGAETLRMRALLSAVRCVVPESSVAASSSSQSQGKRMRLLLQRRPRRINGYNMFVGS